MKILLIEDDMKLKKYIKHYLEAYEYSVYTIDDFSNVMESVKEINADLILLDVNLPYFDGFYFLKLIRKEYNIPVIMVSARSEEAEQIRGMELGADDYVTKPFSMGVLLAKINAKLRRVNLYAEDVEVQEKSINGKNIKLIHDSMKLSYNNEIIELSKNEYRILNILVKNSGKVVSREDILAELWDNVSFVDDNTLTVNVTRVKKRLDVIGLKNAITTKRGVGYVFNEDL